MTDVEVDSPVEEVKYDEGGGEEDTRVVVDQTRPHAA